MEKLTYNKTTKSFSSDSKYQVVVFDANDGCKSGDENKYLLQIHKLGSPIMNGIFDKVVNSYDEAKGLADSLKVKYQKSGKEVKYVTNKYWEEI